MQFIISHWAKGTSARCGVIKTHHSEIQTPVFIKTTLNGEQTFGEIGLVGVIIIGHTNLHSINPSSIMWH